MSSPLRVVAVSLHLTPKLTENLRALSFEGLKALPRRGVEIGGLLTSAKALPSLADEVVLAESEYLFGPSYHLSDRDLPRLRNTAAECRKKGRVVAAYFRSSTRPNDEVDANDRRAIAEACPDTAFMVIVRPAIAGSARIRIFHAEHNGQWAVVDELNIPSPAPTQPFNKAETMQPQEGLRALGNASPPAAPPPQAAEMAGRDNGPATTAPPADAPPRQPFWRGRLTARNLLILMLIIAGLAVVKTVIGMLQPSRPVASRSGVSTQPSVPGTSVESGLGLTVRPEGQLLHLTWNRDSPAVKTAGFGILQILDGSTPAVIQLATSELTEGSLIYTPHSQDVTFRLRLGAPSGQTAEEVIRVFGAAPAAPAAAPPEPVKASAPPPEREPIKQQPSRPAVSKTAPPVQAASRAVSPRPIVQSPPSRTATAPTTRPPAQQSQKAQPTTLPSDAARQNSAPASREPEVTQPPQQTSAQPPLVASPSVAQIPQTSLPAPSAPSPLASEGPLVTYPTPLRQVQPSLAGTRWTVPEPTVIATLVSVDPRGLVTDARVEIASRGKSVFLEGLCVNAARQWTFKPATIAGKPVAGKYRIEFVFRPK